jgi:tetratricopeptide (TPR) repeat protein
MLLYPRGLAVFYPLPREIETWQVVVSAAFLVVVTMLAIRGAQPQPYLLVGWMWYLGTLVPVIGLVQVGAQALADRYTYIPMIGLTITIAWGVEELTRRPLGAVRRPVLAIASLAICAAMVWRTWVQIAYWRDTMTLFSHALEVTPDNYLAHDYVGTELSQHGRRDEATEHFRRAIEIRPDYADAQFNLGNALRDSGDVRGAIAAYQQAVALRPRFAAAWNNLGVIWASLGDWNRAAAAFGQAVESTPDSPDAHANLARTLEALGKPDAAAQEYQRALALNPRSEAARRGLERLRGPSSQPPRDR